MPKYNTGQDFDEAFISGLQFQQKINLQRDELQQDIMFKIRQQSLLEDFRNKSMAQDQSQFESGLALKQQGLTQEQEQFETKKELDLLKLNEDTRQFDKTLEMKEKQFDKELGLGYSKLAQDRKEFDLLYPIKKMEAEGNYLKDTQSKEPKLSDRGSKALNFLTNPNYSSGFLGLVGGESKSDLNTAIDVSLNDIATDVVSAETYNYFKNLKGNKWGSPLELAQKINADKNISAKISNELEILMNYYEQVYPGIEKIQKDIE